MMERALNITIPHSQFTNDFFFTSLVDKKQSLIDDDASVTFYSV